MKIFCTILFLSATLAACSDNNHPEQANSDTNMATTIPPPQEDLCADPAAMGKIRAAISLGNITGMTHEEEKEWMAKEDKIQPGETGITNYSADTLFYEHCIISIDVFTESMGAYPSGWHTYLNFDMRTGDELLIEQVLDKAQLGKLATIANRKLQKNISENRRSLEGEDLDTYNRLIEEEERKFKISHFKQYFIRGNTITFVYPFDFVHAVQALEPDGNISFSAEELQPYLKKDGLLAYWTKK